MQFHIIAPLEHVIAKITHQGGLASTGSALQDENAVGLLRGVVHSDNMNKSLLRYFPRDRLFSPLPVTCNLSFQNCQ